MLTPAVSRTPWYPARILRGISQDYRQVSWGTHDHRRQSLRVLPPDRAGADRRPRRGDAAAAEERGRWPLRPALRAAQVRQDEPLAAGAGRRREAGRPRAGARRSLRRRLARRRGRALRTRVCEGAAWCDPRSRRGVPAEARSRPLARGVRDQRPAPARTEDRRAARAARAARPAATA